MGTSIRIKINEVLFLACMCLPFKIYEKASLPCHFFFRGYLVGIDGLLSVFKKIKLFYFTFFFSMYLALFYLFILLLLCLIFKFFFTLQYCIGFAIHHIFCCLPVA